MEEHLRPQELLVANVTFVALARASALALERLELLRLRPRAIRVLNFCVELKKLLRHVCAAISVPLLNHARRFLLVLHEHRLLALLHRRTEEVGNVTPSERNMLNTASNRESVGLSTLEYKSTHVKIDNSINAYNWNDVSYTVS